MILHLYRVEYQSTISYAIKKDDRYYFVDPKSDTRLSVENSAAVDECLLLNPTTPSKIIGVGLNYRDHAAERNKPLPTEPLLFLKPPSALLAPGGTIVLPESSQRVDPEGELAVIMGERATNLSGPEEARNYIFGYSVFNDVTARDLQDRDVQFTRAKGFDTFAPYGPCIAVGVDPSDLAISTRVNGEIRQQSRTSQLIFPTDYLVWYVSQVMSLYPGDVIATGTPSGIAPIQAGDIVEIEIESIGILRNKVSKRLS